MTTAPCPTLPGSSHHAARQTRPFWILRMLDQVRAATALHQQHQALLRLDDAMLRDIGLTRAEAETEANRPVWDAPTHWRG